MTNILSHNKHIFDCHLVCKDYWDFQLSKDYNGYEPTNDIDADCFAAEIDITKDECVGEDQLFSFEGFTWNNAVNNGLELYNIGYTGMDNGYIHYDKNAISNRKFLDLFFNSTLSIKENDKRLILTAIMGNNQYIDYSQEIVTEDDIRVAKFNGGFYQGFFKDCESDYQVLPSVIESGWTWEITFKKKDFENENTTLNDRYPENKGIILYIGTRAENKWWERYTVDDESGDISSNCDIRYVSEDYVKNEYVGEDGDDLNNVDYLKPIDEDLAVLESYFADDYVKDDYKNTEKCDICHDYVKDGYVKDGYTDHGDCSMYVKDGYLAQDEVIDPDMNIEVEGGFSLYQANVEKITTDNKFLFYDRTPDGFQAGCGPKVDEVTLMSVKKPKLDNYFLLFDRTCHGYTTENIDKLIDAENNRYDILNDLYRNAFAIQIRDDGSIGYKYLVKDCDSEDDRYKIESEFTGEGVINDDTWYTVHIKILPEDKKNSFIKTSCPTSAESMRVYIYVDGRLVFKSKKLPMLNLKALDDLCEKQEGVPFNLSLGGGTQGLCDVIYLNYRKLPKYVLPLEREFGGTFIGFIKSFRFFCCGLNFNQIDIFS